MSLPDCRIKFPPPLVDFVNDVGVTGQPHDSYPAPGQQARYDWMRLYLIGLLSNQACAEEPSNYREGTLWFDVSSETLGPVLKIRRNDNWVSLSDAIDLQGVSLTDWFVYANSILASAAPELYFYGSVTSSNTSQIQIPTLLHTKMYADTRAFVTINPSSPQLQSAANQNVQGLVQYRPIILGPQDVDIVSYTISLKSIILEQGDTYMVSLRRIPDNCYISATVPI